MASDRAVVLLLLLAQCSTSPPCSGGGGQPAASSSASANGRDAFLGFMGRPMGSPLSSPTMQALLSAPARNSTTLRGRRGGAGGAGGVGAEWVAAEWRPLLAGARAGTQHTGCTRHAGGRELEARQHGTPPTTQQPQRGRPLQRSRRPPLHVRLVLGPRDHVAAKGQPRHRLLHGARAEQLGGLRQRGSAAGRGCSGEGLARRCGAPLRRTHITQPCGAS